MLDKDKIAVVYEVFWADKSVAYTTLAGAREYVKTLHDGGFADTIRIKRITNEWIYGPLCAVGYEADFNTATGLWLRGDRPILDEDRDELSETICGD